MSILNQKIQVVKDYIYNCVPSRKRYKVYVYGSIPNNIINNARNSYATSIPKDQILGIIDTSSWGNGKSGIVFGTKGYCVSNCRSNYLEYPRGLDEDSFSSYYNANIVNKISSSIYQIDKRDKEDDEFAGDIAKTVIKGVTKLIFGL